MAPVWQPKNHQFFFTLGVISWSLGLSPCSYTFVHTALPSNSLFIACRVLDVVEEQRLEVLGNLQTAWRRVLDDSELDVLATLDRAREGLLLLAEDGRWVVLELLRADLLGVADRVVAATVTGDGNVAGRWDGETAAGGDDTAEVEALEAEALGLRVGVVGREHWGAGEELRLQSSSSVVWRRVRRNLRDVGVGQQGVDEVERLVEEALVSLRDGLDGDGWKTGQVIELETTSSAIFLQQ